KLFTHIMLIQLILYAELYFTYQMVVNRLSVGKIAFLSMYFPFFTSYCIFSNIGLFCYFFVSSQYIKIKQRELLQQIHTCNKRSLTIVSFERVWAFWREFKQLNQNLHRLCKEIHCYNNFWGLYLTIYFLGYILLICYMA